MRFKDISGLADVKERLVGAIKSQKIAHAQLFLGAEGSANLALALAYASYLNCENRGEEDSCGECQSCKLMQNNTHPDLRFVFPVAGTDKLKKSDDVVCKNLLPEWRKFLEKSAFQRLSDWGANFGENKVLQIPREESRHILRDMALKPFFPGYKILLIWLPEKLHSSAANALLKIIEEPSNKTIFLLVCEDREKLLGTIASRTQQTYIRSFHDEELSEILQARGISAQAALQMAHFSDGSLITALEMTEKVVSNTELFFQDWMRDCYAVKRTANLLAKTDDFNNMGKRERTHLLEYGMHIMREMLVAKAGLATLNRSQASELEFVQRFQQALDVERISRITTLLNEAHYHLERNAHPRILFTDLSFQIRACLV